MSGSFFCEIGLVVFVCCGEVTDISFGGIAAAISGRVSGSVKAAGFLGTERGVVFGCEERDGTIVRKLCFNFTALCLK